MRPAFSLLCAWALSLANCEFSPLSLVDNADRPDCNHDTRACGAEGAHGHNSAASPISYHGPTDARAPALPAPVAAVTTTIVANPNDLADYEGHTNQDYATAQSICDERKRATGDEILFGGTECRHREADKLRDARRAREPARKPPCEGITVEAVRDIETRFPRTMHGLAAMPVAVSTPFVSTLNGEPTCAVEMVVTFNGEVGFNYRFLIERQSDRIHLNPVYPADLRDPPPIRLYD